jgi:hypothetical protein
VIDTAATRKVRCPAAGRPQSIEIHVSLLNYTASAASLAFVALSENIEHKLPLPLGNLNKRKSDLPGY